MNLLIQFLSKFNAFSEEEITQLCNFMQLKEVKKNTILIKEGELHHQCIFVLKGCLRQYITKDGIEKTIAIYTEEQAVIFFQNEAGLSVSECALSAIEDSVIVEGNAESEVEAYKNFPQLEQITRNMMANDFGKTQKTFADFITSSPEERYLKIMNERPDLLQRVPQVYLASFLGLTPESLSRLKKRVLKK